MGMGRDARCEVVVGSSWVTVGGTHSESVRSGLSFVDAELVHLQLSELDVEVFISIEVFQRRVEDTAFVGRTIGPVRDLDIHRNYVLFRGRLPGRE